MSDYIEELRKLIGTRPIIMCGANVILLDEYNRILLHHRVDNDTWGLPGGVMELGESLEKVAASFFSIDSIPDKISPPVRVIIDEFTEKYEKVIGDEI